MKTPGIGIITYKRPQYLKSCLVKIQEFSPENCEVVVFSDTDKDPEAIAVCGELGVRVFAGKNRGVVWNKNRALFYFMTMTDCDPIIILEDDTYPIESGWVDKWVSAAAKWLHVNFSHPAIFTAGAQAISGDGTPDSPHVHSLVTGQCTAVSRSAMMIGGYLDTRFKGYGHGHVEWTRRHANLLYGGLVDGFSAQKLLFLSIHGGLKAENAPSFRNESDVERNGLILRKTYGEVPVFREPWSSEDERKLLLDEIDRIAPVSIVRPNPGAGEFAVSREKPQMAKGKTSKCVVDRIAGSRRGLKVVGWAVDLQGEPIDTFDILCNGHLATIRNVEKVHRPDVQKALMTDDSRCGFEIDLGYPEEDSVSEFEIEIIGNGSSLKNLKFNINCFKFDESDYVYHVGQWSSKDLYLGSIFPHERQFSEGNFIGLALTKKFERDISHNIYRPFPVPSSYVSKIQAQDVFEHIEYDKISSILDEIYRVLVPGGIFRLSVPDYRGSTLRARSVFDENGEVIADLMMGGSVSYNAQSNRRKVSLLTNGDAHLWFPKYEKVRELVERSDIRCCAEIVYYHYYGEAGDPHAEVVPDLSMPVMRSPPNDRREGGKPVSIIVDFKK